MNSSNQRWFLFPEKDRVIWRLDFYFLYNREIAVTPNIWKFYRQIEHKKMEEIKDFSKREKNCRTFSWIRKICWARIVQILIYNKRPNWWTKLRRFPKYCEKRSDAQQMSNTSVRMQCCSTTVFPRLMFVFNFGFEPQYTRQAGRYTHTHTRTAVVFFSKIQLYAMHSPAFHHYNSVLIQYVRRHITSIGLCPTLLMHRTPAYSNHILPVTHPLESIYGEQIAK